MHNELVLIYRKTATFCKRDASTLIDFFVISYVASLVVLRGVVIGSIALHWRRQRDNCLNHSRHKNQRSPEFPGRFISAQPSAKCRAHGRPMHQVSPLRHLLSPERPCPGILS